MRFDLLSAKCPNKTLVPPIARQVCSLDHKPKSATTATPQDQACAPRRHFAICYSSFHMFVRCYRHFPALHEACHVVERTAVSFEMGLMQRLRAVRKSGDGIYWIFKTSFGVERSTLCRALVEVREVDLCSKRLLEIEM